METDSLPFPSSFERKKIIIAIGPFKKQHNLKMFRKYEVKKWNEHEAVDTHWFLSFHKNNFSFLLKIFNNNIKSLNINWNVLKIEKQYTSRDTALS